MILETSYLATVWVRDDFRLLAGSLTDIDVILYDKLLMNLRTCFIGSSRQKVAVKRMSDSTHIVRKLWNLQHPRGRRDLSMAIRRAVGVSAVQLVRSRSLGLSPCAPSRSPPDGSLLERLMEEHEQLADRPKALELLQHPAG